METVSLIFRSPLVRPPIRRLMGQASAGSLKMSEERRERFTARVKPGP